jgi:hypothetical protein
MNISDWAESKVDKIINNQVKKSAEMDVEKYLDSRRPQLHDIRAKYLIQNLHNVYNNTSSLLTHVSAMIASLGIILIVFSNSKWSQLVIFIEMVFYAIFAIACVYSLKIPGMTPIIYDNDDDEYVRSQYIFYLNRRYIYHFCLNGIIITTIFFLITIIVRIVAGIFIEDAALSSPSSMG